MPGPAQPWRGRELCFGFKDIAGTANRVNQFQRKGIIHLLRNLRTFTSTTFVSLSKFISQTDSRSVCGKALRRRAAPAGSGAETPLKLSSSFGLHASPAGAAGRSQDLPCERSPAGEALSGAAGSARGPGVRKTRMASPGSRRRQLESAHTFMHGIPHRQHQNKCFPARLAQRARTCPRRARSLPYQG